MDFAVDSGCVLSTSMKIGILIEERDVADAGTRHYDLQSNVTCNLGNGRIS